MTILKSRHRCPECGHRIAMHDLLASNPHRYTCTVERCVCFGGHLWSNWHPSILRGHESRTCLLPGCEETETQKQDGKRLYSEGKF